MKTTVNIYRFRNEFEQTRPNNFSYDGLTALFNYFEEYEESCNTEVELDVIALCCEFTEYVDLSEIQQNYNDIESMEDLNDHTMVIEFDSGIIIQNF